MDFLFSGNAIHFAALLLVTLLAFAAWTALKFPRIPSIVPQVTSDGGRPVAKSPPNGSDPPPEPDSSSAPENEPYNIDVVRAQPKANPDTTPETPTQQPPEAPITATPTEEPAPVEFRIYAPSRAPPDVPFDIRINISIYDSEFAEIIKAAGYKTFETLVLVLRRGDPLRLELQRQPRGIELDAPEQTIIWNGRDMTVVFVGRLPISARPNQSFTSTLKVYLYELPLGLIQFSITADELFKQDAQANRQYWDKLEIQQNARLARLEGKGFGALRYKSIFISHVSSDIEAVSYIRDFLEYSGIKTVFAPTDFYAGPQTWKDLAQQHVMHTCNSMLLCWSEAASRAYHEREDSPIKSEMEMAVQREKNADGRQFALIPYQIGDKIVPLPKGYDERPMNSPGLSTRMAHARKHTRH